MPIDKSTGKAVERDYQDISRGSVVMTLAVAKILQDLIARLRAAKAISDKTEHLVEIKVDNQTVYKGVTGQKPEINKLTPEHVAMLNSVLGQSVLKDLQISVGNEPVYNRVNGVVEVDKFQEKGTPAPAAQVDRSQQVATESSPSQAVSQPITQNARTEGVAQRVHDSSETVTQLTKWREVAQELGKSELYIRRIDQVLNDVKSGKPLSEKAQTAMQQDIETYVQVIDEEGYAVPTENDVPKEYIDTDGDGLNNATEEELGTSPFSADTDMDGIEDSQELAGGSTPLSPGSGRSDVNHVRNLAAIIVAREVLDRTGGDYYKNADYCFQREGGTVTIAANDGRGEIARLEDDNIIGQVSSADVASIINNEGRTMSMGAPVSPELTSTISERLNDGLDVPPEEAAVLGQKASSRSQVVDVDSTQLAFRKEINRVIVNAEAPSVSTQKDRAHDLEIGD